MTRNWEKDLRRDRLFSADRVRRSFIRVTSNSCRGEGSSGTGTSKEAKDQGFIIDTAKYGEIWAKSGVESVGILEGDAFPHRMRWRGWLEIDFLEPLGDLYRTLCYRLWG